MNPITTDTLFPLLTGQGPDKAPTDDHNSTLKMFEQIIDRIVSTRLKENEIEKQAAIEKAKAQAEQQRKIAFLLGAAREAEEALAGISPAPVLSPDPKNTPPSPSNQTRDFMQSQVVYWKAKLTQASISDDITEILQPSVTQF